MRILWDCRSISPFMGGIGHANVGWLRQFLRVRPESWNVWLLFSVVNSDKNTFIGDFSSHSKINVITVQAALIDSRFENINLPVLLERHKIDCYVNPCFSLPAIKTTRLQVSFIHDIVFFDHPEWVEARLGGYLRHGTDLAMQKADAIFTVSEFSRQRINTFGTERGWNAIPSGNVLYPMLDEKLVIEARKTNSALKSRSGNLRNGYILYLGSIEFKKGITILLDAYRVLHDKLGSHCPELVLAGGVGGQSFDLNAALASRNLSTVKYLGRVSEEQKHALFVSAHMFVFPSHYEGFGIPPLEAMACGVPVIASRATSLPEVLGDGALYFDEHDCSGLACAIEQILTDHVLRERMTADGRKQAIQNNQRTNISRLIDTLKVL